jgi:4-alpha-glucanotransferase
MEEIFEQAARLGLETQYWNAFGELRAVSPDVLAKLTNALTPADAPVQTQMLPRSIVMRGDHEKDLRLPGTDAAPLHWQIFADGKIAEGESTGPVITLPAHLGHGIFRLLTAAGGRSNTAALILAPVQAYQGKDTAPRRMWALAVQLYSVRSRRNWGHGDFSDLLALVDLAADLGAAGIGLNPLHALFDDRAELASPYSPNSRLFLNPLYIDVESLPEFPGLHVPGLQGEIEQLRNQRLIDYAGVGCAKMHALKLAYENFLRHGNAERRRAFNRFQRERGATLARFACFEVLRRKFSGPWWDWPQEWRTADEQAIVRLRRDEERAVEFFEFVQWAAHEQLDLCRARCEVRGLPVGLYLDIAVGVRSDGFDAWYDQNAIVSGVAIGAPPDALNRGGQNWGLAAFNPIALEARQFEPFRHMLIASMRYGGAIRLDHVLGLQRLYLIPDGTPASEGTYIRCPFEALLAMTALTSVEEKCIVIGEDLGTVPEKFRGTLASWGIWSYQVMLFERTAQGGFSALDSYREQALVTFATHDLPTFAGWREQRDLALKQALAIDPGETREQREAAVGALRQAIGQPGKGAMEFASVARYLADAPSRLLVISVEDLLGVSDQINVPGTIDEYPNWRHRLPVDLEDLPDKPGLKAVADIMRSAGRSASHR